MFTFMSLGSLLAAAWYVIILDLVLCLYKIHTDSWVRLLFVPMISKTMFNLHSGLLNSTLK